MPLATVHAFSPSPPLCVFGFVVLEPGTLCLQLTYSPWLNPEDPEKCLFVSVHGYGKKERGYSATGWFYPGSGETTCCSIPEPEKDDRQGVEGGNGSSAAVMDMDDGSKEERAAGVGLAAQREVNLYLLLSGFCVVLYIFYLFFNAFEFCTDQNGVEGVFQRRLVFISVPVLCY